MTDAPDEERSNEGCSGDETPNLGEADSTEDPSPVQKDDADDVVGIALDALRAMIDPSDDPERPAK